MTSTHGPFGPPVTIAVHISPTRQELIEALAAAEHARWSRWQSYFFSKCIRRKNGDLVIPAGYVQALERQIALPYAELTPEEQQADRDEVAHILPIIEQYAAQPKPNVFNVRHEGISGRTLINGEEQEP